MKTRILAFLLAALMIAALCACGGQSAANTGNDNASADTLVVGISTDLDSSLDPHVSSSSASTREVLFNIYEGLMKPDPDGNLIPALAESYVPSESADQYTFTLRQGVKFHNGADVTVEDVVYSLTRAAGLETGEPLVDTLAGIASVEATDDKTVVITLSAPDAEFVAYTTAAIIPAGSDPADGIIGTGPFRYVSRSVQESIELERFDDYWGEKARMAHVTLKVIENAQTMVMSLRSGAIDMATKLEYSQVTELEGLTVLEGSMATIQALYLDNSEPPFDDIRVRQALCYAINKHEVIDLAADGHGFAVGSSMYPAFGRYFDDSLTDYYETDPDKAMALLAEAGYGPSNPLTFTITVPSQYIQHVNAATVMVEQLKAVGVNASINEVEWTTWYNDVYQGRQFEATVVGMDAKTLTASAFLQRFTSDNSKNFISFDNADYDAAYAAAVSTVDEAKQTELFIQCETILTQQAANVYIQDSANFVVTQNDIAGYRFYPMYIMDLSTVYRAA